MVFVVTLKTGTLEKDNLFMIFTYAVSLSLLLSASAASPNLLGWDVHAEYNRFLQVSAEGLWHPDSLQIYNSVLSITILPSILSEVCGLNGILLFKFGFPLLFSLVPLVLYMFYRKFMNEEGAFLAVFLFMAYPPFYVELIALARQEVAELLLVIVLLTFLSSQIRQKSSAKILTLLLTFGIVIAHYSIAIIYIALLGFSSAWSHISRRTVAIVSGGTVLISLLLYLIWYAIATTSSGVLFALALFIGTVLQGLTSDLFNPTAGPTLLPTAPGLATYANAAVQYLVQLTLLVGLLALLRKSKDDAEKRVFPLIIAGFAIIAFTVSVPFFAFGLGFARLLHIAFILVAPCFGYGVQAIGREAPQAVSFIRTELSYPSRPRRITVLGAAILFSFFLLSSGWIYATGAGPPSSFILDSKRMADSSDVSRITYYFGYSTQGQDIASAQWLNRYFARNGVLCGDWVARQHVLTSYGNFPTVRDLPSACQAYLTALETGIGPWPVSDPPVYVYLTVVNTQYRLFTEEGKTSNVYSLIHLSDSSNLRGQNRIYSDGGSTVYL
jgi:uncharacterized membrane protein